MSTIEAGRALATSSSPLLGLCWLSRPRLALWVAAIPLYSYGFAHWDAGLIVDRGGDLLLVVTAWMLLSAGTMWLNAALDQHDTSAVFARPAVVPAGIRRLGAAALALAVGLATKADTVSGAAAALAALLSVLYSHPRTAWKGHPILGPAVNVLGYGCLSPAAGWALSGARVTPRALLTVGLWSVWMLGAYFAAQVFQGREDAERGFRTLVVTRGPLGTLRTARGCINAALMGAAAATAAGIYPRLTLFAYPLFVWADARARRWLADPNRGDATAAESWFGRMLLGGLAIACLAYLAYWIE